MSFYLKIMQKTLSLFFIVMSAHLFAQQPKDISWKPAGSKITTQWAGSVNPKSVHQEYPRPQLERTGNWMNLNGLWDYAILKHSQVLQNYQGKILVPFAVESSLSGVGRTVGKDSLLFYRKEFVVPKFMKGKEVLLHFGAVDWRATVAVNGKEVGVHEGGFDPFSFNITKYLNKNGNQTLTIKVWDPSDEGAQPRGKQIKKPHGIWYTPVTGIWQTVWLEAVHDTYIDHLKITPDIDNKIVKVNPFISNAAGFDEIKVTAFDGSVKVAEEIIKSLKDVSLGIPDVKLWDPNHPFLYTLKVELLRKGKSIDQVVSYFAMRKISMEKDEKGIQKMLLNNKFVFQYGPLDQGWWPDGLYTAPSDEALKFDIEKTKEMGFNMIRKHIKVEPARWYTHCDKMGVLVWQDMPSGDLGNGWEMRLGTLDKGSDKNRTPESEAIFKKEWNAIMDALHNFPSIVVWVPFNEAWGQFKTREIAEWTKVKDPSRLVNTASGGNFHPVGDIIDLHNYPHPAMPDPAYFGKDYALVLGEFGGLGLPVKGHVWQDKNNWGYQSFKNEAELLQKYESFMKRMRELIDAGLSAAVYTQTTDVEIETNGLMTYDRKVIKIPPGQLKSLHQQLYDRALKTGK